MTLDAYHVSILDYVAEQLCADAGRKSAVVSVYKERWEAAQTYGFVWLGRDITVRMNREQAMLWQLRRHEFVKE